MKKHPIIVIKLGTSSIVHEKTHQPLLSILALIVETAVSLRQNGYKVVIVSSGAIGTALRTMGLPRRPKHLPQVQALAAIGQCKLMGLWDHLFERMGQTVAQILLTRNDIADRTQYLNAQNTFSELLNMGVIPIVNENDTLAVSEIKFGDNDTLSAITAGMVQADYLFLMTDVDCLYDKNPRTHPDAKAIEVVENISDLDADVSSAGSALGTGGMSTKIVAARLATAAGVTTIITRSSKPGNITGIVNYIESQKAAKRTSVPTTKANENTSEPSAQPPLHTRFLPSAQPIRDRHFWLLHGLAPHGTIYIDAGAGRALADHAGLLAVGIVDVEGSFAQQECVRLVQVPRPSKAPHSSASADSSSTTQLSSTPAGAAPTRTSTPPTALPSHILSAPLTTTTTSTPTITPPSPTTTTTTTQYSHHQEIGRALVNYSASEIRRIAGRRSTEIANILGYADSEYVAFRENVAMLAVLTSRPGTPTRGMSSLGLVATPAVAEEKIKVGALSGEVEQDGALGTPGREGEGRGAIKLGGLGGYVGG